MSRINTFPHFYTCAVSQIRICTGRFLVRNKLINQITNGWGRDQTDDWSGSKLFTHAIKMYLWRKGLKMLDLYLLGQNCLHLTFKPYLSSETYSRKCEKLPNIVVLACKILQKRCICWKCLARKFGFVCLRFDPLRRNS